MPRDLPFRERSRRRFAIAAGRAARTVASGARGNRIVFMHMPKCGGTSLSEAMYATVPFDHRIGVIDAHSTRRAAAIRHFGRDDIALCHEDGDTGHLVFDLRETLLLQHMAWDTMLIHGHVLWSERAHAHFGDVYRYVTILRDPVERTVSNFRMAVRTGNSAADLAAYLDGPLARRQARVFLRYLSGRNDIAEEDVAAEVEVAKRRLDRFALVGFLDDVHGFSRRYAELFGARLSLSRLNAAPPTAPGLPAEGLARLERLCAPDIEIFEHARSIVRRFP